MTHALPDYLTRNVSFDACPPGHRFGLYFNGWEADWRKPSNKTPAFKTVAGSLPQHRVAASPNMMAVLPRDAGPNRSRARDITASARASRLTAYEWMHRSVIRNLQSLFRPAVRG